MVLLAFRFTKSQRCHNPLKDGTSPEMSYNYSSCSTVIDWSLFIRDGCQDSFDSFEVQIRNGCTNSADLEISTRNFSATQTWFSFTKYRPGECLVDNNCYARIKPRLNGIPISDYSPWVGLSNAYRMIEGTRDIMLLSYSKLVCFAACAVSGTTICFPLGDRNPTLPMILINQNTYIPGNYIDGFNVTVTDKICFINLTKNVHLLVLRHEANANCNYTDSSTYMEELTLLQRIQIEVTSCK